MTKTGGKLPRELPLDGGGGNTLWASGHMRFGWWSLVVFSTLGIVLEMFHGFKIGWYLDGANESRRLMWTLAHAHGTLLSLVHIALANSAPWLAATDVRWRQIASPCLYTATITLPGGFFLAGLNTYSGDPGLGIVLAPIGGFLLLFGVAAVAWGLRK